MIEPYEKREIKRVIYETLQFNTSVVDSEILTAMPAKTFLEKSFLLHELFSTNSSIEAERKSRHLYDLEKMMDNEFALEAINNDELWEIITPHRKLFTPVKDVCYSTDIRNQIILIPPVEIIDKWRKDYNEMAELMIFGDKLDFDELISRMDELQNRFRNRGESLKDGI